MLLSATIESVHTTQTNKSCEIFKTRFMNVYIGQVYIIEGTVSQPLGGCRAPPSVN